MADVADRDRDDLPWTDDDESTVRGLVADSRENALAATLFRQWTDSATAAPSVLSPRVFRRMREVVRRLDGLPPGEYVLARAWVPDILTRD